MKIVFVDCDGTLKNDNDEISQKTKDTIKKFIEKGNYFVLCTGRPRYRAEDVIKEINCENFLISANGAEIYNNIDKKVINSIPIEENDFIAIYEYVKDKDINFHAVVDNKEFVTKEVKYKNQFKFPDDLKDIRDFIHKNKVTQMLLTFKDYTIFDEIKENIMKITKSITINHEDMQKNNVSWISFGNSKVSKGNALEYLANYLGIEKENTIAIGNDFNDISMFKVAGTSVATSNAIQEIKDIVDVITDSNNEDGVAKFLEKTMG